MKDQRRLLHRLIAMGVLLVLSVVIMAGNLFHLQVVRGAEYQELADRRLSRTVSVRASRGEILDRYGRPLVTNRMAFSLSIDYLFWDQETQNDTILRLAALCQQNGAAYEDTLPISDAAPFSYSSEDSSEREQLSTYLEDELEQPADLTAEEAMAALIEEYEIDETLTPAEQRIIAGGRYQMVQTQFSMYNNYTFASDVSIDLVSQVEEQSRNFPGVEVQVDEVREYQTDSAAHILGWTGPIYREEYEQLREEGYALNAIIGKDGIERVMEEYLRGIDGEQTVETNISGQVVEETETKAPEPGNNVMLTLDIRLQEAVEQALEEGILELRSNPPSSSGSGSQTEGGAAVVIEVDTGEILAMASYPTYSLETIHEDYNELSQDPLTPLFNRAIAGAYAPGSTYKLVTAIAGLEEGVITTDTIIEDEGRYTRYEDYQPQCWLYRQYRRTHGRINVTGALRDSCNYFFYEVGYRLGGATMESYAKLFGLGSTTGIELAGESAGMVAGPTNSELFGSEWLPGNDLSAAIGQSDHQYTVLQIANMVATLCNGGDRYGLHLVKSVKSNDFSETVLEKQPELVESIDIDPENLEAVLTGMNDVVNEGGTAASVFRNYPIQIGGKSGSSQTGSSEEDAHGVFVAFAPYDDPEIVVCVVGEHAGGGSNVAYIVRDILDAYFFQEGGNTEIVPEYQLQP